MKKRAEVNTPMLSLVKTCGACPEQYDVFLDGKEVGYLRLRHGWFRAECPFGGKVVYSTNTKGDGSFADDDERDFHLTAACLVILEELRMGVSRGATVYQIENDYPPSGYGAYGGDK